MLWPGVSNKLQRSTTQTAATTWLLFNSHSSCRSFFRRHHFLVSPLHSYVDFLLMYENQEAARKQLGWRGLLQPRPIKMPERRGWWQGWRLRACSSLLEKQHFSEKLCWPSLCDIISGSCELNQISKKLEEIAFKLLKSWPHLAELQNRDVCFCEFESSESKWFKWPYFIPVTSESLWL